MRGSKHVPASEWKWFGVSAHFICGEWCRFHLATQIGEYIVSTVGKYVHPSDSKNEHEDYTFLKKHPNGKEIGCGRFYETMVFKAGKPCKAKGCNCGLPSISGSELMSDVYTEAGPATDGHRAMCEKVAAGLVQDDVKD